MGLAFGSGSEAHAGDSVSALDRNAVGGKGPLVDERAVSFIRRGGGGLAPVTVEGSVRIRESLDMGRVLFVESGPILLSP